MRVDSQTNESGSFGMYVERLQYESGGMTTDAMTKIKVRRGGMVGRQCVCFGRGECLCESERVCVCVCGCEGEYAMSKRLSMHKIVASL